MGISLSLCCQIVRTSASLSIRSRGISRAGGLKRATGDVSISPRITHQCVRYLIAESARFARVGVPLEMMSSSTLLTSRRLIWSRGRSFKPSNFFRTLSVRCQSLVLGFPALFGLCKGKNASITNTRTVPIVANRPLCSPGQRKKTCNPISKDKE